MVFFVKSAFGKQFIDCDDFYMSGENLKIKIAAGFGIPSEHFLLYCQDHIIQETDMIKNENVIYALFRLAGGKGGFGSMLRAIGAQIEKTTNKEACRDLSGRRLRDINEEKRLKKWIAKQAERENEEAEKKKQKLERLKSKPKHEFQDPNYDRHRSNLVESINDALTQGLQKEKDKVGDKRPSTSTSATITKKPRLWIGMEEEELDSEDVSDDETNIPTTSQNTVKDSSNFQQKCQQDEETSEELRKYSKKSLGVDDSSRSNSEDSVTSVISTTSSSISDSKTSDETSESMGKTENQPNTSQIMETSNVKKSEEVNLEEFDSVEELEKLGLENLKNALIALNVKCGGTLRQRAERLFSIKGLNREDIPPSLLAKPSKK